MWSGENSLKMDIYNKLFRVDKGYVIYLYFTEDILYVFVSSGYGIIPFANENYDAWKEDLMSYQRTGLDPQEPNYKYDEIPLEVLLTNQNMGWREFAKEKLQLNEYLQ